MSDALLINEIRNKAGRTADVKADEPPEMTLDELK